MPGGNISYHFRNEKWIESRAFILRKIIITNLFLKSFDASNSGREDNSDTVGVFFFQIKS